VAYGVSWFVVLPLLLFLVLYLVLLITPIPLPFIGGQVRERVLISMPDTMNLELGSISLTLEKGVAPALRFSPVVLMDRATGGRVEMEALEVGFSPFRVLLGQPGTVITLVRPKLQVIQDLHGPRLAQFETADNHQSPRAVVRIIEGEATFPKVTIRSAGVDMQGDSSANSELVLRSDNDWLIFNLEAAEQGLRSIVERAEQGLFSRFLVRDGNLEMLDSVYGFTRTFENINLDIGPQPSTQNVDGTFSTVIAGQEMNASILRRVNLDGSVSMIAQLANLDFSAVMPFINDPGSMIAMNGTGDIISEINFAAGEGISVLGGEFSINMTGMDLRIRDDYFPITTDDMVVKWSAPDAQFEMRETRFQAGPSYADVSGVYVFGLDENFGPTMRMTTTASNVYLHPNDLDAPATAYQSMQFVGWSAPLYGALGIESMVASSGDMILTTTGRIDMLARGIGINLDVAIEGARADDLKRIWPYVIGDSTRDWFVKNVLEGKVITSAMKFRFPIGSIGGPHEDLPIPDGAMSVDILASDIVFDAIEGIEPIQVAGETRLQVRDGNIAIDFGDAGLPTSGGVLDFSGAEFSIIYGDNDTSTFLFDGNINAPIDALLALAQSQSPEMLEDLDLPLELSALSGNITTSLSAQIALAGQDYEVQSMAYALDGTLSDFASSEPIGTYTISEGQLAFQVDENGYKVSGPTKLNGLTVGLDMEGNLTEETAPEITVSANFAAEDFKQFGFDVSQFVGGNVRFTGQPLPDGSLRVGVNLKDASLTIADLGLSKPRGEAGSLEAVVRFDGSIIDIGDIDLSFGTVRLRGGLKYHEDDGLISADFPTFAINEGDRARLALAPIDEGFSLRLRGEQLDLKPLMQRFFSLEGGGTGGPRATSVDQAIVLDAKLDRALGFFRTVALNLDAQLSLKGETLNRVVLRAQFGGNNSLSITTNPVPGGRAMSVAFNDLGTLLRFTGVYPRLVGGSGSLVMSTDTAQDTDRGIFSIKDFSLIDEANVAQILGNDPRSRETIARQNRVDFNEGRAEFVRKDGVLEITEAVLDGGQMGGTARGYIYTDTRRYDLVGTYIPLFGLNNAFQQIPILGPLLGGRDGEGLIGVTFAVRGDLDNPEFAINPASILVPGAFRSLFEFRARERTN